MMRLSATILKAGINPYVDIPAALSGQLGKGYLPVRGRINGHDFRSGLVSLGGGRHRLFVNGQMRRQAPAPAIRSVWSSNSIRSRGGSPGPGSSPMPWRPTPWQKKLGKN